MISSMSTPSANPLTQATRGEVRKRQPPPLAISPFADTETQAARREAAGHRVETVVLDSPAVYAVPVQRTWPETYTNVSLTPEGPECLLRFSYPQGVGMDFLVNAFVVVFVCSAGFIATLAVIGRHKNPPGDT